MITSSLTLHYHYNHHHYHHHHQYCHHHHYHHYHNYLLPQYRRAVGLTKNASMRSFQAFGFGAAPKPVRSGSQVNVNVCPNIGHTDDQPPSSGSEPPEIKKYQKKFKDTINCAALWGLYIHCCLLSDHLFTQIYS